MNLNFSGDIGDKFCMRQQTIAQTIGLLSTKMIPHVEAFRGQSRLKMSAPSMSEQVKSYRWLLILLLIVVLCEPSVAYSAISSAPFPTVTNPAAARADESTETKNTAANGGRTVRKSRSTAKSEKSTDSKLPPSTTAAAIIKTAKKEIGRPYRFGGTTPKGFDCSGFTQYVFDKHKIKLPRMADEQYKVGSSVSKKKLSPGDLVFFSTYEKGASHVGILVDKNQFIHVSSSKGVRIDKLDDSYWKSRYLGARKLLK